MFLGKFSCCDKRLEHQVILIFNVPSIVVNSDMSCLRATNHEILKPVSSLQFDKVDMSLIKCDVSLGWSYYKSLD